MRAGPQRAVRQFQTGSESESDSCSYCSSGSLDMPEMEVDSMGPFKHKSWSILKKTSSSDAKKKCGRVVTWDEPIAKFYAL